MKPYIIYQVMKADLLERVRRSSFLAMCIFAMFLAFFSVPDVEAPLVSICMEPGIFSQGSNPSWIPIAIALCGGVLFPMIGLSFVKNNISMDRGSGLLYSLQSMNMKKGNYIIGKFLSNLSMLALMWLFVMLGAALMLPFRFPDQPLPFYDFISPFIGIYPGIVFVSAFAVLLESVPFISSKAACCTNQFMMERRLLLKSLPKSCLVINVGLWIYSIFAPLQYVQGYLWIIMLICSVALFSQMGCREHENSLTECFVTIKSSLVRQIVYSYLWAAVILFTLSMPVIIRCFTEQKFLCSCSYIAFSFFVPALACFLGEYSKSRRAFETVYLLICFLLLNMPSFLFQGYVVAVMVVGTAILMPVTLMKRRHL